MKRLIIYDICGTLYNVNTTFSFLKNKKLYSYNYDFILFKAINKISYKLFNYDFLRILKLRKLKGLKRNKLEKLANDYVKNYLSKNRIKYTHNKLEEHKRNKNDDIIIISASLDFIVEEIAKQLNINKYFSTQLEYKDKICQGKIKRDLLGKKVRILKEFINEYDYIIVYTDSKSDFNLVKNVDESYIISKEKDINFWQKNKKKYNIKVIK